MFCSSKEMCVDQEGPEVFILCCDLFSYYVVCSSKYMKLENSELVITLFVILHGFDYQIRHNSLVLHFFTI